VTRSLGSRILPGHRVTVSGPFGSAHFRPEHKGRMVLVATNTGFAPIWAIAVAALRENPQRRLMIIAGGRSIESLYMGPALMRLTSFPNVRIVPVCSTPQTVTNAVLYGRPTDFVPQLMPADVLYACGAPQMVDAVKAIAANAGAVCYADPFLPAPNTRAPQTSSAARAAERFTLPAKRKAPALNRDRPPALRHQPLLAYGMAEQG
jgi:NAD(P)H-flavin reductase